MNITPQDIEAFQRVYRTKTGKSMKKETAYKQLQKLLEQVGLIYKPVTLEEIKALSIENENELDDDWD